MRKSIAFLLFVSLLSAINCAGTTFKINCNSPQYLEIGKTGLISCQFHGDFFAVLWYTEADFKNGDPTLHYQNLVKTGTGYESGEFDVHPNGSLIINEVSVKHEDTFHLAYIKSKGDFFDIINIQVILLVKPGIQFPVISHCPNVRNYCFTEYYGDDVQCSVSGVRPNISLSFVIRTVDGDRNISNEYKTIPEGVAYTSRVTTSNVFHYSPVLVLLVCNASILPGLLEKNESSILVLKGGMNLREVKPIPVYITRDARVELKCTNSKTGFVVWKKANLPSFMEQDLLIYSVFIGEEFTEIIVGDVMLGENASLAIPSTEVKHEGMYFCIFGNGLSDGVTVYNLTVIVPAYPLIDGCNHQQYCVLEAGYEGSLTCTVKGIRPRVQLRWKTYYDVDKPLISFTNQQLAVTENGDTFDVTLISKYRVRDKTHNNLTVECKVEAIQQELSVLTMKIDLLFVKDPTSTKLPIIITVVVIVALCLVLIGCGIFIMRFICTNNNLTTEVGNEQEMTAMFDEIPPEGRKQQFRQELQQKYKDLYDAIQPIPYIKDRLYCVDRVFVEGGIEYLDLRVDEITGQWTSLDSYQNVFNDSRVKSTRRILEGEPGYGKSTVTLQFAYDWCNSITASALRDVDILVILRLRQLGGVTSIYRAIKQFILPKDSRLSESDIENILQDNHSVVIILDGFDEYPDQDSSTSDVISIIGREMFQKFEVVLTTRSSFLPKKYPPSTKRLKLTGFDEKAREYYIRKAVVGDNDEGVKRIEEYLDKNPILSDLCQVPLLFVIFAHMTYENETFRNLNSVTSFFRYMISCFHSHMKNKMKDENVNKCNLFETDHGHLDKVAFEALSKDSQRIVWERDELCQQLGGKFYDQYIRIGILVEEEEVIDIVDDPCTLITEHVQYKTEVRFYHKLFCEWYAAHYLSDYLEKNPNLDLSEFLRHLDPFDVQYLYRFSCGLNPSSFEKIIDYLHRIKGGNKFVILCILEQADKIDNIKADKNDNIKESIRQLCFEGVIISSHDSLLLQRSTMKLLETAAGNDIPIEYLQLHNCLQSVDLSKATIRTTSGLDLTSNIPVKWLGVELFLREMTEDEHIAILEFCSMCPSLRKLQFKGCAPPRFLKSTPALSNLCSRNVTVSFGGSCPESPKHLLNLSTLRWEREEDGLESTDEDFERMNSDWDEVKHNTTEERFQDALKINRNRLREEAKEKHYEAN